MVTPTKTPSLVWKGSTLDGYTLLLSCSGLAKIMSNLKQTGLKNLVKSNMNGSLKSAVVRSIDQIVSHAKRSGTVAIPDVGKNIQVFTAVGRTRNYQILTQPSDSKQSSIIFVRSQPIQEFEYEDEYERMLDDQPDDILNIIGDHLDDQSLARLSQTNRRMRDATQAERDKRRQERINYLQRARREALYLHQFERAKDLKKQIKALSRQ